ncbi:MAG: T9SS type A sorting domain-containing protein [Rhodothermia bacterium]|nr:T9SS type A sorting domain-containing protein [Rhodothermia bacterium]
MRSAALLTAIALLVSFTSVSAQEIEFDLIVPNTPPGDLGIGYTTGIHSGARDVKGPFDGDGDGKYEVYVADYTAGGRVHVVENVSADVWELVYTTPFLDSTATVDNIRAIAVGDLDGDTKGEIYFLAGRGYSDTNPNIGALPPGLYAFESVGDNDWGSVPATVYEFDGDLPDRWRTEHLVVDDVDNDGKQELFMSNNGSSNRYDNWYVFSVQNDIGSGFETWIQEIRWSSRVGEDFDPVDRGGGSAYSAIPADLDGDGQKEIVFQAWNNFNLTTATVPAADTYETASPAAFLNASTTGDDVSFFGGVAVDVNGDGDDEVFYPILCWSSGSPRPICGSAAVVNYESGEDPLTLTSDNVAFQVLEGLSELGITAGDLDGDGKMEVIGSPPSYTGEKFDDGEEPVWLRIAEYEGGDVESASSYTIRDVPFPADMLAAQFNRVERDSLGVMTVYHEAGDQGPEFTSKLAFLGDPDLDGVNEVAISIQGVDDSTSVISEVFNAGTNLFDRTTVSTSSNDHRVFLKIINGSGAPVGFDEDRIVLPSDYKLFDNYPNPFNPSTTIGFELPLDKNVNVRIYDVSGRLVKTLIDNQLLSAGTHEVTWSGRNESGFPVASGTYIYALEYGNFRQAKEMVLIK